MSTFILIIKILPWILSAAGGGIGYFQRKKIKSQNKEIDKHKEIEKSLRRQIVEMVELQGDKNEVIKKNRKGKKNINTVSDEQLSIDYGNKLPNVPTRKDRKK